MRRYWLVPCLPFLLIEVKALCCAMIGVSHSLTFIQISKFHIHCSTYMVTFCHKDISNLKEVSDDFYFLPIPALILQML
jgi:hypothetical protein